MAGPLDALARAVGRAVSAFASPRTVRNLRSELAASLLAKIGIALITVIVLMAVFAPLVAPHNPTDQHLEENRLPPVGFSGERSVTTSEMVDGELEVVTRREQVDAKLKYPLGTDSLGRDMLSRIIYGARTSLLVGLLGTLLATAFGVPFGLVSGYYGGLVDDSLMRVADIMLAFPSLVLAIALVGVIGRATVEVPDPFVVAGLAPGMPRNAVLPGTVVLVVALVNWVWFARVARSEALAVRNEEFVKAAKSMGAGNLFVIRRHVLPNSITPIIVLSTIQIAAIILLESSLSFLGFSGTTLSWGFDISQGRDYLSTSWWISTGPGLAIVLAVMGINLIGDWLRDALDPGIQGEGGA